MTITEAVEQYHSTLVYWAMARLGKGWATADAEDCVQLTWLRFINFRTEHGNDGLPIIGLLSAMLQSVVFNYKKQAYFRHRIPIDPLDWHPMPDRFSLEVIDFRTAIGKLHEPQRTAILYEIAGMKKEESAALLDVNLKRLFYLITKARVEIAALLHIEKPKPAHGNKKGGNAPPQRYKLTPQDVRAIRAAGLDVGLTAMAKQYNVTPRAISKVRDFKTYKDVQ